jgi:hypothetical protein
MSIDAPLLLDTDTEEFGLNATDSRTFSAVVAGTHNFNRGYNIVATAIEGTIDAMISVSNATGDARTITVLAGAVGSFSVKAVAKGNANVSSEAITINVGGTYHSNYLTSIGIVAQQYESGALTGTVQTTAPSMMQGTEWIVGAVLESPAGGTIDKTYEITITGQGSGGAPRPLLVEELPLPAGLEASFPGGRLIKVSETLMGNIRIEVEANETAVYPGVSNKANWLSPVTIDPNRPPDDPDWATMAWKFHNTAGSGATLNAKTTLTLPVADNKRYRIYNNESNAMVESDSAVTRDGNLHEGTYRFGIRNATFMYLNNPIIADMRPGAFRSYGIEARVRISADAEGVNAWGVARNVVIGAFSDPEDYVQQLGSDNLVANPQDIPAVVGIRIGSHGERRGFHARYGNPVGVYNFGGIGMTQGGGYDAAINNALPEGPDMWLNELSGADFTGNNPQNGFSTARVDGFRDDEFVYRIMRHSIGFWTLYIFDRTGQNLLLRSSVYQNSPDDRLIDNTPHYFGFLISGVEAEISDIKIFHGVLPNPDHTAHGAPAWYDSAVADATPKAPPAKRINFSTARTGIPNDPGVNLTLMNDDFAQSFLLNAVVVPFSANRVVTFELGDATGTTAANGIIELETDGEEANSARISQVNTGTPQDPVYIQEGKRSVIAIPAAGVYGDDYKSFTAAFNFPGSFVIELCPPSTHVDTVNITAPANNAVFIVNNLDQFFPLTANILPKTTVQGVTWSVALQGGGDASAYASIDTTGTNPRLKIEPAIDKDYQYVTLTATSVHDNTKSASITLRIMKPIPFDKTTTFLFGPNSIIDGGTTGNITQIAGMTYTVDGISMVFGTNMDWRPAQAMAAAGEADRIITGCAQVLGDPSRDSAITISGLQGPFRVSVVYTATGGTNIVAGGIRINGELVATGNNTDGASSAGTTGRVVSYIYTGEDEVTLVIVALSTQSNQNIRIFELKIDYIEDTRPKGDTSGSIIREPSFGDFPTSKITAKFGEGADINTGGLSGLWIVNGVQQGASATSVFEVSTLSVGHYWVTFVVTAHAQGGQRYSRTVEIEITQD